MAETIPPLPNPSPGRSQETRSANFVGQGALGARPSSASSSDATQSEMYRYHVRMRSYIVSLEKRLKALEDA